MLRRPFYTGVTLIELVLVIIIISIAAVFAKGFFEIKYLKAPLALEQTKMALAQAKQIAQSSGCNVKVEWQNAMFIFKQQQNCDQGTYFEHPSTIHCDVEFGFKSTPVYTKEGTLMQDVIFKLADQEYIVDAETGYVYPKL